MSSAEAGEVQQPSFELSILNAIKYFTKRTHVRKCAALSRTSSKLNTHKSLGVAESNDPSIPGCSLLGVGINILQNPWGV